MKIEAITNVKQVQEYFESYKRTNNTEYLDRITDYLDTCKAHDIIIDYGDIRELLCQNSKGDSLLEVILRNEDKIDFVTILKIQSTKYSDNYPDLIESFFLKKPELLKYLDAKSLVYATVNGERLIDYMFKNNLISIANVQKCTKYYEEMIEWAFKYHREDLLQHLPSRVLLRNENGKTIAEDLIDRGVVFDQPKRLIDSNLVEILIKKRQFLALKKLDEKILLKKSSNGKTILEILLDYNIDFDESVILRDYRSIGIIIEKERFDLLKNIGLELLVQDNPGGKTWLEYFIALHNDGAEINFSQIQLNLHNITSKNLPTPSDDESESMGELLFLTTFKLS